MCHEENMLTLAPFIAQAARDWLVLIDYVFVLMVIVANINSIIFKQRSY
jgi:hypothetical protein